MDVTSELIDVDWDVSQEVDYHVIRLNQRDVSLSHRYTNKSYDMNYRNDDEKLELARTLIMSRDFFTMIAVSYDDFLADPISDILSEFASVLELFKNPVYFQLSQYLVLSLLLFSSILLVLFIFVCLPPRKSSTHIKQVINLMMIKQFNKQSAFSLLLLGFTLSLFFGVCYYNTVSLEPWPTQLQLSGYRVTLTFRIIGQVLDAVFIPRTRVATLRLLERNLVQLESAHTSLLFQTKFQLHDVSAGRYAPQNELLFNTRFNVNEFNSSTTEQFGLNFLITKFIIRCSSIVNQEDGIYWNFDNPSIQELVDVGRGLTTLSLDSLDLYQEELNTVISNQRLLTVMLLILFFLVAICLYFFVFRRMLRTLKDEEEISFQLISMIPQSIVDSNEMLAEFVRSFG
ncbi:hypothetical protein GEMRC1_011613 [Eukaryota sp. GEM-RC1]